MTFFIRFISTPEHAQSDFERGYSYRCYCFFDSIGEAENSFFVQDYGVDPATIVPTPWQGQWGFALEGLCGFEVDVDTLEEALEEARERGGYNGVTWPFAAVYSGEYIGVADGADGDVFRASELLVVAPM